jgi:hypothetical protein
MEATEMLSKLLEPGDIGFGHEPEKVHSLKFNKDNLKAYAETVRGKTNSVLASLSPDDMDTEIPDLIPGQTIKKGMFLARALMVDNFQHSGQIAYLRGHLTGFGWSPT